MSELELITRPNPLTVGEKSVSRPSWKEEDLSLEQKWEDLQGGELSSWVDLARDYPADTEDGYTKQPADWLLSGRTRLVTAAPGRIITKRDEPSLDKWES